MKTKQLTRSVGAALVAILMTCTIPCAADGTSPQFGGDLLNPKAHQFDFALENLSGFIGPGSIVRVREFQTEGTGLHFPALGINTVQLPDILARFWFDQLNALEFRFRYFDVGGSRFLSGPALTFTNPLISQTLVQNPVLFNGATLAGNQTLDTNPTNWFSLSLYYERRLTPLYKDYEAHWPEALQGWETRAKIGIEYTYIDFEINSGHAKVTKTSKGEETKEDFYHQELPIPTIGLEALHRLPNNFTFDASVSGNWINKWNSLRNEGGTVWLSQNGVEAHARILYSDPMLGPFHLMVGMALYYYSQLERSREDGNFIRWFTYGPEYGIVATF